ncbi:MAG: hypothetical protein ACK4P1_07940, partial [Aggregatilineales bacterium]
MPDQALYRADVRIESLDDNQIAALLDGRFDVVSAAEAGVPEPDETESTFVGNALLKARHAAERSGLP